jgi:glutathione peroxidase
MLKKLKNIFIVIAMLVLVFSGYVIIVNRNTSNMTARQKILKAVYPMLAWANKFSRKNRYAMTHEPIVPPVPFYSLNILLNDGTTLGIAALKGKKILLVNTASDCGYTSQYEQLQKLYSQHSGTLTIIGFPANDFKEQEKGTDEEIALFCKKNFGVSFPLAQKSIVIKSPGQNDIFQWLTDSSKNGWNNQAPTWNFCKYLVNEEGALIDYFGPGIEPMSEEIRQALESNP